VADTFKVLAQGTAAGGNALGNLYTVPAARSTTVSTLAVCNTGTVATTFRIAIRPAGAAQAAVHWLYYDATIGPSVTLAITIGITLAATDVISVAAAGAGVNFHVYGVEVS
jgi:hypothetical protein